MEKQPELPDSTTALILGIGSIFTCFCYGLPGLALGIAAVIVANKSLRIDQENPGVYRGAANARAGKITGMIGLIMAGLLVLLILALLLFFGFNLETLPEILDEFEMA